MASTGVYQIDREMWDHPFFKKEPYTEKQAWAWLLGQVEWKKTTGRVGRFTFELERGQAALSRRFIASKWLWTKGKVDRFIQRTTQEAMIRATIVHGMTVVTICNYDKYQFGQPSQNDWPGPVNSPEIDPTERANRVLLEESLRQERKDRQEGGRVAQNEGQKPSGQTQPDNPKRALLGTPPPPDPWFDLKREVMAFIEEETGHLAEVGLIDEWKASGYEPIICKAVVMRLLREDPTRTLAYMPKPVKRAHEEAWESRKRAVAPPPPKPPTNWGQHLMMLKRLGEWPMALGPRPGFAGCRVPHETQVEFGFLPANQRVSA